MYKDGGLFSVTSRILIVDMLKGVIPVELITGLVVLHAEECVPSRSSDPRSVSDPFLPQGQANFARSFRRSHLPPSQQGIPVPLLPHKPLLTLSHW